VGGFGSGVLFGLFWGGKDVEGGGGVGFGFFGEILKGEEDGEEVCAEEGEGWSSEGFFGEGAILKISCEHVVELLVGATHRVTKRNEYRTS